MLERYHNIGGHLRLDPEGTLTSYADAQATIADLQGQVEAAKAQHEDMITRNKILRDRPDLPPDRAEWHDAFVQMQQRVAQLESGCEVCRKRYDNLSTQYSTLQADHARVLGLVQAATKLLTELTIIPIGCSREQELAWKKAVKDLRAASLPAQPAQGPVKKCPVNCLYCNDPDYGHPGHK